MLVRREIQRVLGSDFVVALNMAPTTPDWLRAIGGVPMALGLDLSGGVHFLMEVDTHSAVATRQQINADEMKSTLRNQRIRYHEVEVDENNVIYGRFRSAELRDQAVARSEERRVGKDCGRGRCARQRAS